MRVPINTSSVSCLATALLVWVAPLAAGISVPTGKLGPITPAKPQPRSLNPHAPSAPAQVVEYTEDRPEPPPLDPSYKPYTYNYFNTLARHHVYWVPVRYRNFNADGPNDIGYEPPQKYFGQTLGKNTAYKSYKRQLQLPYLPVRPMDWGRQQWSSPSPAPTQSNPQPDPTQFTTQFTTQPNNGYNNGAAQTNNAYNNGAAQTNNGYNNGAAHTNNAYNNGAAQTNNGYNNGAAQTNNAYNNGAAQTNNAYNNDASQASSQYPGQYTAQPTQQQQFDAVSTQTAPASTLTPQPQPQAPQHQQLIGKGSYDVTGKGGSRSEYYTKADWSKKAFPKKALGGTGKFSHKY